MQHRRFHEFWSSSVSAALCVALFSMPAQATCDCDTVKVPDPKPADIDMQAGIRFTHTAQYQKEFSAATRAARAFCSNYKAEHPNERNIAVVSDIDETILDNREELERPKFNWDEFPKWVTAARAPVLKDTVAFLRWARKNGFAIFLITGRPETDRVGTIENLVRDQVEYDALYLRPGHNEGPGEPAETYKSGVRKSIEDAGFRVVVNIGDQFSDLADGHSLDCEKLPNKMYFIP
jgi:acid phosphatase